MQAEKWVLRAITGLRPAAVRLLTGGRKDALCSCKCEGRHARRRHRPRSAAGAVARSARGAGVCVAVGAR
jgi:hypothetical protein